MKTIHLIILLAFSALCLNAQSKIIGYEFWFNNDFGGKLSATVSPVEKLSIQKSINASNLPNGIHTISIRALDEKGKYSATVSQFFYKTTPAPNENKQIAGFEYWFNNDYTKAEKVSLTAQQHVNINELISSQALPNGIHTFNIRFWDNTNIWSATTSQFFYKSAPAANDDKQIAGYEYWFNNDYTKAVKVNTTPGQQLNINELINAQTLPNGIHTFNIRFADNTNKWSATTSQFFYKSAPAANEDKQIAGYEYWFNNDYTKAVKVNTTPGQQLNINELINAQTLPNGIHSFNIRLWDNTNIWSTTTSQFFYKSAPVEDTNRMLTAIQYWFDNDFSNVITIENTAQQQININKLIETKELTNGIHTLNMRFKDNTKMWSSPISQFFYKNHVREHLTTNKIIAYRYWLSDHFDNHKFVSLDKPVSTLNLYDLIDLSDIENDNYNIHFQFKDTLGLWSSVTTDSIYKNRLTKAEYTYFIDENCDTTVYHFSNLSVDANKYLWDFGDNNTSNEISPLHSYSTPGKYLITLNAIDTINNMSSIKTREITIKGTTYKQISVDNCQYYVSPSAKYTFSKSGTYQDTIPNKDGCDSIITIQLNIRSIDLDVSLAGTVLTANQSGAKYQWLDCNNNMQAIEEATNQSFAPTTNGSYAVEITYNNCIDTTACYQVTTVHIIECTFSDLISLYPNPTNGDVSIDLKGEFSDVNIYLHDVTGKLMQQNSYMSGQLFKLTMNLPSGIYLMTIVTENKRATLRVVKH